jgi:dipeptidyl aminopeptidase/acylaminoacyl peptidase
MKRTLSAFVIAGLLTAPSFAQTRGATAEDYFAFESLGEPQALTSPLQSSTSPRWRPDGRALAFLSARPSADAADGAAPRSQVWLLPLGGGEPRALTSLANGVSAFQWSPDGTRLVVVSRSGPSDDAKSPSDVRHYAHSNYKFNDTGWFDDKRAHLWVVDAATGKASPLTAGDDWNDSDPQWSPDGRRIAFVSDRTGKAFDEGHNTDVWVIDAGGGPQSTLVKISDHEEGDSSPRWSPDGRTIAFVSAVPEKSHARIWLAPATGGAASKTAADGVDLIPTQLRWAPDGRTLYFETGFRGTAQLIRVDLAARRASPVTSGDRTYRAFDLSPATGKMAFAINDPTHLDDLYVADLAGTNQRQLTRLNSALWKQLTLSEVERLPYKGADGWDVDGFFMKPVGWEAGRKYPMILSIHGGPAGQYGFDWYHEFQVYAAHGWAVFFANPRGSTGYGEKFERGIELNWGGNDYVDVMNGVDAALAKYPWIDRDRLGVTGGSYGGFLTNWIVGHTNRFKAAVTLRSIANFVSDDGTRDGAYGHADDFQGDIFEKPDLYWDRSPLKYAKNVKTPTLVLHSDFDFRVPIEQGEQWFRALRHFGVPSEIVFFPRENHNLTRTGEPRHLVESINWQVYWFDRYLNGNAAAVPPDAPARKAGSTSQNR